MQATYSEPELVRRLALGQMPAFDALYHRYQQPVFANILKLVKAPEAAEDLLQEVFLSLWAHRQALSPDKSVGGWLFVVSYNKAATSLRQQLREAAVVVRQPALADTQTAEEQPDEELHQLQVAMVEEAVSHLPARKQQVFRLCRFEGKSYEEAAATIGISVQSVKDYLKQSTSFIRKYVQAGHNPTQAAAVAGLLLMLSR